MTKLRIAALGSSFAAGPGLPPYENQQAARSTRNYAHQLAEKLDAHLTDISASGATLLNVLNEQQDTLHPQLHHLPSDATIVTLTCGGNDLGYISGLTYDSALYYLGPLKRLASKPPDDPSLQLDMLVKRFLDVLDKIHEIAPNARVYLVEYLSIIGDGTRPKLDVALTADEVAHHNKVADVLRQAYETAAGARQWAELVPVAERSKAHALGSAERWVEGFSYAMMLRGGVPYHPNLAGHTAVASILYEQIRTKS